MPENIIESQICDILRARGWILARSHVGLWISYRQYAELKETGRNKGPVIPVRVGKKGMPDWIATRILEKGSGTVQRFEFEVKAPGRAPSDEQYVYIAECKAIGVLAEWFDGLEDCRAPFLPWYRAHFDR